MRMFLRQSSAPYSSYRLPLHPVCVLSIDYTMTVFSVNILLLAIIFKTLLDKSGGAASSASKKIALLSLGLKIPVLVGVLYYLIRVISLPVLNIFVGSIMGMFVTGWLFFEDYLQNLAD